MGLLSNEYYTELVNKPSSVKTVSASPILPPKQQSEGARIVAERQAAANSDQGAPVVKGGYLSEEEQVKKYGGVVGSQEYYKYKEDRYSGKVLSPTIFKSLASVLGVRLPDDEEWDRLSAGDKARTITKATGLAATRVATDLPKATVRAVMGVGVTALDPLYYAVKNKKLATREELGNLPKLSAPWVGEVPSYYQNKVDAENAGIGPVASELMSGYGLVLDVAGLMPVTEALANTFKPRGVITEAGVVKNTAPLRASMDADGIYKVKADSASEYYTMPKSNVKQFGGRGEEVKWKFSPTAAGETELAVVKSVPKKYQPGDYVRTEFGLKRVEQGDFGPEIKVFSQSIKAEGGPEGLIAGYKKIEIPDDIQEASSNILMELETSHKGERVFTGYGADREVRGVASTFPEWVPQDLRNSKLFDSFGKKIIAGETDIKNFTAPERRLFEEVQKMISERTGRPVYEIDLPAVSTSYREVRNVRMAGPDGGTDPIFIPPKALQGMEKRQITPEQLDTINKIGKVKGLDPVMSETVAKAITGKDTLADLTQAEFVKVAEVLGKFGEKYGQADIRLGPGGYTKSIIAPQRHYFDFVEDKYGIPLKSRVYEPMERAARLTKQLDSRLQPELDDIFGEYAKSKYVEERRILDAYVRGNTDAIAKNPTLSEVAKKDLLEIAEKLKKWDDTHGELLGVGRSAYLQNYGGPKVGNTGGVIPQYKNLDELPSKNFFAKFKRRGSLDPYIDDPLASRQIYIKEGTKALHYGPVLRDFEKLVKKLPPEFAKHANSYVQEKLGRLGAIEKFVDSFVPAINKKLGVSLPADASRQAVNYGLSTLYSGLVGTPAAIFKQTFQLPTFVYARLGTEFAGEAIVKSFKPLERARVAKLGFLNDAPLPYGAELAKEFNPAGKVANAYKKVTQATLKPLSVVDNDIRIKTFLQAEMQWNKYLNAYNKGEITWPQLESKLDFKYFSKADRNIIRQSLARGESGVNSEAFGTYMREILDETSFPYRTGSGAKIGYGLGGKLATGLLNYTIESTNVLYKWFRKGEYDKLIRFAGNAGIMNQTMQETFGVDFSETLYQKPLGYISPVLGLAGDMYKWMEAIVQNNRERTNEAKSDIIKTLRSGMPAGIVMRNAQNFWKSVKAGEDANGEYPIYDDYGKLVDNGDFADVFWGTLMGFPTEKKRGERSLYNAMKNSVTERDATRDKINQLMREGKYDEMEALVRKTGVMPSQSAMESYYVPRTQRFFQSLPADLKAEYAPRVFDMQEE